MAKRKKINSLHLQKIEKAKHRNDFLVRMKQFCDEAFDPTVFPLIPSRVLDEIYLLRCRPLKLVSGVGQTIPSAILNEMKSYMFMFKTNSIPFAFGSMSTISVYDFYSMGLTLVLYGDRVKDSDYPGAALVKQKLEPLVLFANSEAYNKTWHDLDFSSQALGMMFSDFTGSVYTIKPDLGEGKNGKIGVYFYLNVYATKAEKIQVELDGHVRPAFRLGWPNRISEQVMFAEVRSEHLNLHEGHIYIVYIQSHALERLSERVDSVDTGYLHFNMYNSFKNPKVCKNKKGDWLFEFNLHEKKIGYFKGDVIDGKIILRTFLFLTNNGTPEGERLHEHTGMMKEDKMYLTIDKLSSFTNSDIKTNEHVKDIFIKAGCQSLFEINEVMRGFQGEEKSLANLIENYLTRAA